MIISKEQWVDLQLWYYSWLCRIWHLYGVFRIWWLLVNEDWYLETPEESRQFFWDSLSFNKYF
jgi:hypothetical protein